MENDTLIPATEGMATMLRGNVLCARESMPRPQKMRQAASSAGAAGAPIVVP
ncbi:hypothetical protein MPLDJ20_20068 [Mesorhizobium plurifarium]|uniref:Uncharacterized protein n=1 Tax=Mesorhizobium plurifarium TaxID=69974 RepID=A0A090GKB2_MESPL|nr:hypothetical protein MPLDJ20_20068 [Mesorhizobium plurifarium]